MTDRLHAVALNGSLADFTLDPHAALLVIFFPLFAADTSKSIDVQRILLWCRGPASFGQWHKQPLGRIGRCIRTAATLLGSDQD
jgi:hypothetical protein